MRCGVLAAAAVCIGSAAAAADCRLALVLALDVSSSVDAAEDQLQRGGLAAALLAPEVERALFSSPMPVALAVYEWSGRFNQEIIVDWTVIANKATLITVAESVGRSVRRDNEFPTAMGYALGYGVGLFKRAPTCLFRTIDIAGDGENNDGFGPEHAYAHFPFQGVTVNGLVVNGAEFEAELNLIDYYRTEVIRGPGAFLEVAQGFADYERAMRRKLERELRPQVIGAMSDRDGPG